MDIIDISRMFQLFVLCGVILETQGSLLDGCAPPDPDCHPSCIVYDTDHCRLCRCPSGGLTDSSLDSGGFAGGSFTDAAWDRGLNGDWSSKLSDTSAWENTGSDHMNSWSRSGSSENAWNNGENKNSASYSGGSQEKVEVRYVYVEKQPIDAYPDIPSRMPSPFIRGGPSLSSPFSSVSRDNMAAPSSAHLQAAKNEYVINTHAAVMHVPLLAPGQPRFCARCHILSCPSTCERVDEYGCHSCPCAPSRFQTMPVMRDCSDGSRYIERTNDCQDTKRCIANCKHGYKLGATGRDGCRECTCLTQAQPSREQERDSCPATVACMLRCKDGYILGETRSNGCPSCKCLAKGFSATGTGRGDGAVKTREENTAGSRGGSDNSKWGSFSNSIMGHSGSSNNMLSSTNGVSKGECKPPMCLDGNMSVDQAMKMGTDSAKGHYTSSMTSGMSSMTSGSSGIKSTMTSGHKDCFPMCAGGTNGQYTASGGGNNVMLTGGPGSKNNGCSGPFCATMSGMGSGIGGMGSGNGGNGNVKGGMASGNGGMGSGNGGNGNIKGGMGNGNGGMGMTSGGSGMPFSPFSAAMSSGGPSRITQVSSSASNKDCFGPSCSSKDGLVGRDCSNLVHCLVTCAGKPLLGQLDQNGCQVCTCS